MLERIRLKSEDVLKDFMNEPGGLVMPEGLSFHAFFEEIRMEKRKFLFPIIVRLETREKNADIAKLRKYDLFQMAAQRVVYRYIYSEINNFKFFDKVFCAFVHGTNVIVFCLVKDFCVFCEMVVIYPPSLLDVSNGYLLLMRWQ